MWRFSDNYGNITIIKLLTIDSFMYTKEPSPLCPSSYEVAVIANDLTVYGARFYEIDGFTHLEPAGCGVYCQKVA